MQPIIYWFRNDLRLYDNIALWKATESNHPILFIYILNEDWFKTSKLGFNRISNYRLQHLYSSLNRLKKELSSKEAVLHIYKGKPTSIIADLAKNINAKAVFSHHEYAADELMEEQAINNILPLQLFWGNMVYPPTHVPFSAEVSPYYYTKFMKKVIELSPALIIPKIEELKSAQTNAIKQYELLETPITEAPLDLMNNYLNSYQFEEYSYSRELFEGDHYSSFLSPFLADGSLSANIVFQKLTDKLKEKPILEPSITKFQQQLIWRDYYRFLFLRYGSKLFYRHGIRNKNRDRYDDLDAFKTWMNGTTDHPLINAFMNEIRTTGFLSNRGRMLVSYYLSKVMQVNWLWGAQWFEHLLIDYDVCNNYGNWAYQSGVGTDSRFNRSFNLDKQIEKFDPRRVYLAKWANKSAT
nr:FAD-binding domain-containing protein [uncultured Carboxylicivirga sp.]